MPDALIMLPGRTQAQCTAHGYQDIIRAYSLREALGLPDPAMLPDEPPFLSASPHETEGGDIMDFPPIGHEVRQEQETRQGMSHGDLYLAQLLTMGEQALNHAQAHLDESREAIRRIRAAHAAGIQWQ